MVKKVVHIFADYDSALGEIVVGDSRQGFDNLFDANLKLNKHILDLCDDSNVEKVIIHCFSTRQDGGTDAYNADNNGNGSAFHQIGLYVEALQKHSSKIHLETILANDVFLNKEPGWQWEGLKKHDWPQLSLAKLAAAQATNDYDEKLCEMHWQGDTNKVTLFMIHAWHAYFNRLPACEHHIQIFDDKTVIFDHIHDFFEKNPRLFPPSMSAEFYKYWHFIDDNGIEQFYYFEKSEKSLKSCSKDVVDTFHLLPVVQNLVNIFKTNQGDCPTLQTDHFPNDLSIKGLSTHNQDEFAASSQQTVQTSSSASIVHYLYKKVFKDNPSTEMDAYLKKNIIIKPK